MMDESNDSMMALVKNVSGKGMNEELFFTIHEYDELVLELFNMDKFLQDKYKHPSCVPRIFSLYGVKITIS